MRAAFYLFVFASGEDAEPDEESSVELEQEGACLMPFCLRLLPAVPSLRKKGNNNDWHIWCGRGRYIIVVTASTLFGAGIIDEVQAQRRSDVTSVVERIEDDLRNSGPIYGITDLIEGRGSNHMWLYVKHMGQYGGLNVRGWRCGSRERNDALFVDVR